MEPHKLRRWRRSAHPDPIRVFSCARPGRSAGSMCRVPDAVILKWIQGLPEGEELSLISLLGRKPDGTDEHSFYSFKNVSGFRKWLRKNAPRTIHLFEYPATDFQHVDDNLCAAISARLDEELSHGRTVVIVDSGGVQRTGQVCRRLQLIEDSALPLPSDKCKSIFLLVTASLTYAIFNYVQFLMSL
jgi:hypothetical protein